MEIDPKWPRLVLRKLKRIMMDGSFGPMEPVRYVYNWDKGKSIPQNLIDVALEDSALNYFLLKKVVVGEREEDHFREGVRKGFMEAGVESALWGPRWSGADPSIREYDWVVWLYGFSQDKFELEAGRFGLKDVGTDLEEIIPSSPPVPSVSRVGEFSIDKDGSICFKGSLVTNLKPKNKLLVIALIKKHGQMLSRQEILDALWDEDHDKGGFLDQKDRTPSEITKRIGNLVSETNSMLHGYGGKKHIVLSGDTSYRFVA